MYRVHGQSSSSGRDRDKLETPYLVTCSIEVNSVVGDLLLEEQCSTDFQKVLKNYCVIHTPFTSINAQMHAVAMHLRIYYIIGTSFPWFS